MWGGRFFINLNVLGDTYLHRCIYICKLIYVGVKASWHILWDFTKMLISTWFM